MTKFIFFCMAIVALSFVAVPVFTGISNERDALLLSEASTTNNDASLSFEEIYEIAAENSAPNDAPSASDLNNIMPAAGGNEGDHFLSGFGNTEDSALENAPRTTNDVVIEETNL